MTRFHTEDTTITIDILWGETVKLTLVGAYARLGIIDSVYH